MSGIASQRVSCLREAYLKISIPCRPRRASQPFKSRSDKVTRRFRFNQHLISPLVNHILKMTQVLAQEPEDVVVARRKAAANLQQDLKLSLGQSQSLPGMLRTAPLAINLLGQIELLAFSDDALRIPLTEPRVASHT